MNFYEQILFHLFHSDVPRHTVVYIFTSISLHSILFLLRQWQPFLQGIQVRLQFLTVLEQSCMLAFKSLCCYHQQAVCSSHYYHNGSKQQKRQIPSTSRCENKKHTRETFFSECVCTSSSSRSRRRLCWCSYYLTFKKDPCLERRNSLPLASIIVLHAGEKFLHEYVQ